MFQEASCPLCTGEALGSWRPSSGQQADCCLKQHGGGWEMSGIWGGGLQGILGAEKGSAQDSQGLVVQALCPLVPRS